MLPQSGLFDQIQVMRNLVMSNASNDMSELSEILRQAVNSNKATTSEHLTALIL